MASAVEGRSMAPSCWGAIGGVEEAAADDIFEILESDPLTDEGAAAADRGGGGGGGGGCCCSICSFEGPCASVSADRIIVVSTEASTLSALPLTSEGAVAFMERPEASTSMAGSVT